MFNFKLFMDVVETDHLPPTERVSQLEATYPVISLALMPLGSKEAIAGAVGNPALLPIIVVRFHRNTITILGK